MLLSPSSLGWLQHYGLQPSDLPKEAGSRRGRLFVLGSGAGLWDDMLEAGFNTSTLRFSGAEIMAVNHAGIYAWCHIEHWYSNHSESFDLWYRMRQTRHQLVQKFGQIQNLHTCRGGNGGILWPWPGHGSSGLGAVLTGLALGYESIVLCGMPMDSGSHFHDPPWATSPFENSANEKPWKAAKANVFQGRVKSMSGKTREWLGAP